MNIYIEIKGCLKYKCLFHTLECKCLRSKVRLRNGLKEQISDAFRILHSDWSEGQKQMSKHPVILYYPVIRRSIYGKYGDIFCEDSVLFWKQCPTHVQKDRNLVFAFSVTSC